MKRNLFEELKTGINEMSVSELRKLPQYSDYHKSKRYPDLQKFSTDAMPNTESFYYGNADFLHKL